MILADKQLYVVLSADADTIKRENCTPGIWRRHVDNRCPTQTIMISLLCYIQCRPANKQALTWRVWHMTQTCDDC